VLRRIGSTLLFFSPGRAFEQALADKIAEAVEFRKVESVAIHGKEAVRTLAAIPRFRCN